MVDNAISAAVNDSARQYTSNYVTTSRLQGNTDVLLWYFVGDDPTMIGSWDSALLDGNIDLRIDGNGTQLTGVDCPIDPRIADGYSGATDLTAVSAQLAGKAP